MKCFGESLGDLAGHDILLARAAADSHAAEGGGGLWPALMHALRTFWTAPDASNGEFGASHPSSEPDLLLAPEASVLLFAAKDRAIGRSSGSSVAR